MLLLDWLLFQLTAGHTEAQVVEAVRRPAEGRVAVTAAYDCINRDEATTAAREVQKPTRPPYRWSEQSRAARRKPQT